MGPAQAIKAGFANAFRLSGRASRSQFWRIVLFSLLPFFAGLFVLTQILIYLLEGFYDSTPNSVFIVVLLPWLTASLLLLPAMVRRGHDSGLSGVWVAVPFLLLYPALIAQLGLMVPTGGGATSASVKLFAILNLVWLPLSVIFLIWALACRSDPNANRYGPNPNEVSP